MPSKNFNQITINYIYFTDQIKNIRKNNLKVPKLEMGIN